MRSANGWNITSTSVMPSSQSAVDPVNTMRCEGSQAITVATCSLRATRIWRKHP
jgi:hypothetical protein